MKSEFEMIVLALIDNGFSEADAKRVAQMIVEEV